MSQSMTSEAGSNCNSSATNGTGCTRKPPTPSVGGAGTKTTVTKSRNGGLVGTLKASIEQLESRNDGLVDTLNASMKQLKSTGNCDMAVAALEALLDMVIGILDADEKTPAYWRIKYDNKIVLALQEFCTEKDKDDGTSDDAERINFLTKRTLDLFHLLNDIMSEQECAVTFLPQQKKFNERSSILGRTEPTKNIMRFCATTFFNNFKNVDREVVSIVFGGKEANPAQSLSEELVKTLSETCLHVYTISRSDMKPTKKNITHFNNQNLCEDSKEGVEGFVEVMEACIKKHFSSDSSKKKNVLSIYFTMGYHKGRDVYNANLRSANNFAKALQETFSAASGKNIKWKVILTGTDATRPSYSGDTTAVWPRDMTASPSDTYADHPGTTVEKETNQVEKITLTVPLYKIHKYNFVYAMSKIGQFYTIADVVANLTIKPAVYKQSQKERDINLSETVQKITSHIRKAEENGVYDEKAKNIISMDDLNTISSDWTKKAQPLVSTELAVATDLSILYTPLHCRSWVTQSLKDSREHKDKYGGSARAHIVFQIVKRLANAISTDMGTRCHTVHGYVGQESNSNTDTQKSSC